jgi:hypothetical protein
VTVTADPCDGCPSQAHQQQDSVTVVGAVDRLVDALDGPDFGLLTRIDISVPS